MKKSILLAISVAALIFGRGALSAGTIAYDPSANSSGGAAAGFTGTVGLVFTVDQPLTVTDLGITTNPSGNLDSSELWTQLYRLNDPNGNTSDATLLTERNFTAGLVPTLTGIAPSGWSVFFEPPGQMVTLVPGETYVVSSHGFGGPPTRSYINGPTGVVTGGAINHLASRWGVAAGAVPTNNDGPQVQYQGPTFRFEAVPFSVAIDHEPATDEITLTWDSYSGGMYNVLACDDLKSWQPVEAGIVATGESTSWLDSTSSGVGRRFYRISQGSLAASRGGLTAIDASGTLHLDRAEWLARNNLVYNSPPFRKTESIPLGSGKVGAAMWIDPVHGLTAHLNRPEGVPAMAGLGTLRIPHLAGMVAATDYRGTLSIRDGLFTQQAGGLTITSFFRWGGEELVIDVQGADPGETVKVELSTYLNTLNAIASDTPANEGTGEDCIAIAAADATTPSYPGFRATQFIAAQAVGRNIVASSNANGASLSFNPKLDGSYRLVVPVKLWTGSPVDLSTLKPEALAAVEVEPGLASDPLSTLVANQSAAFGARWDHTAIIRLYSENGEARYIEQMLAMDSYLRISASLTPLPAVGGGETRLFGWNANGLFKRNHWYQNLRPVNYANIASGVWAANAGTWNWLLGLLPQLQQHVTSNFPGFEGAGYPEYIDGQPGTAGSLLVSETWGTMNLAPEGALWYTSRMMSSTLEVVGAIISEYQYRQDPAFLDTYWVLIEQGMLFHRSLLMSNGLGGDGRYHYLHVNSRENNWDDDDDTPDVANMRHLVPAVIALAQQRGDTNLVTKLNDLLGKLPEVPTETRTHPVSGLPVTAIAFSALTRSSGHNAENPDLDAIWPANHIGDASDPALVQLANDTLDTRIYREWYDWHPTSVQAARMGRADIYRSALLTGIRNFQIYPQGLGSYNGGSSDLQTEFTAVQTLGAHEALVQNYDGLLRLANSWPAEWEAIVSLPTEGGHRVSLEVVGGVTQAAVIDLGSSDPAMRIRNPWPGGAFVVHDLTAASELHKGDQDVATVAATAGNRLLVERVDQPLSSFSFEAVTDSPNTGPNALGTRILGKAAGDTFGFADPHLFEWSLDNTGTGLDNLGSVANADLEVAGSVTEDPSHLTGTGLSLAGGYLKTGILGSVGSDVGATIQLDLKADAGGAYRRLVDYCVPGSNCDTGFL
ncbi:MAG: DUF4082 domain-containing protein, partial [Akkermansiaceae bacterium]|nr:DUF4082 domain-containing protein [Akkermansiaceae bacterium]